MDPSQCWEPLPPREWDISAARHLSLRLGYSLNENWISLFRNGGPAAVLKDALGKIVPMPRPESVEGMQDGMMAYRDAFREAGEQEKRKMRQQAQRRNRQTYGDYAVGWYSFARDPRHSVQEKLVQFFANVWVVAFSGVRSTAALVDYQERIRHNLDSSYPAMCRQLAVSPAMIRYLNLNQNRKGSPNENFARELFELFVLGEGNYTEQDIKEAARALTGYTINVADEVRFVQRRFDPGRKTVLGKTGNFDLEDIIGLTFEQPAAATFLPSEMARHYLSEAGLPPEYLEPLAREWRKNDFSIPWLVATFFNSRIFFAPEFRGNLIKSPNQYFLGLHQDLDLDVFPSPRRTANALRTMGQAFFNPPNVRGWKGGRAWINSATFSARNQLVQRLLVPPEKQNLNADEEAALEAAKAKGLTRFSVNRDWLRVIGSMSPSELADLLAERLYVSINRTQLTELLRLAGADRNGPWKGAARLRAALACPEYHLC